MYPSLTPRFPLILGKIRNVLKKLNLKNEGNSGSKMDIIELLFHVFLFYFLICLSKWEKNIERRPFLHKQSTFRLNFRTESASVAWRTILITFSVFQVRK